MPSFNRVTQNLYDDIWCQLKAKHHCRIAVHTVLQARVIHAVINKKYYDDAWKLLCLEAGKVSKLKYTQGNNYIDFELVIFMKKRAVDFSTLTVEDL